MKSGIAANRALLFPLKRISDKYAVKCTVVGHLRHLKLEQPGLGNTHCAIEKKLFLINPIISSTLVWDVATGGKFLLFSLTHSIAQPLF